MPSNCPAGTTCKLTGGGYSTSEQP
jgi:hypothetical protein